MATILNNYNKSRLAIRILKFVWRWVSTIRPIHSILRLIHHKDFQYKLPDRVIEWDQDDEDVFSYVESDEFDVTTLYTPRHAKLATLTKSNNEPNELRLESSSLPISESL